MAELRAVLVAVEACPWLSAGGTCDTKGLLLDDENTFVAGYVGDGLPEKMFTWGPIEFELPLFEAGTLVVEVA